MHSPEYYFRIWYEEPLHTLRSIPGGNGGFIALATSCFLYERYARAKLIDMGKKSNDNNLVIQLASDFHITEEEAKAFWDVIRNGLLHQGMPKSKDRNIQMPRWFFHGELMCPIDLITYKGESILRVQPWLFMEKVLSLCTSAFELLKISQSFPFGGTMPITSNSELVK